MDHLAALCSRLYKHLALTKFNFQLVADLNLRAPFEHNVCVPTNAPNGQWLPGERAGAKSGEPPSLSRPTSSASDSLVLI